MSDYLLLMEAIRRRILFLTASCAFIKSKKTKEAKFIEIDGLIKLWETQSGTKKEIKEKMEKYAPFHEPLKPLRSSKTKKK